MAAISSAGLCTWIVLILSHGKQHEILVVLDHLSLSFLMTLLIKIVDPRSRHSYLHLRPQLLVLSLSSTVRDLSASLQLRTTSLLCLFASQFAFATKRLRNWLRAPQLPLQINTIKADIANGSQTFAYDAYFAPVRCSCIDLDAICASRDFCVNQMKVGLVVATWGHLLHVFAEKLHKLVLQYNSLHWQ